jgi:hypothetical protein
MQSHFLKMVSVHSNTATDKNKIKIVLMISF